MREIEIRGDIKGILSIVRAIAYFHKTVLDFYNAIERLTPTQRNRYCKLLVVEYQQFQGINVAGDGRA